MVKRSLESTNDQRSLWRGDCMILRFTQGVSYLAGESQTRSAAARPSETFPEVVDKVKVWS